MSRTWWSGGEPLLQREIGPLTAGLRATGLHITVETAGTVAPDFECDLLSDSPKTINSDPQGDWRDRHQRLRGDREPLRRLVRRFTDHQFKFVVEDGDDLLDILEVIEAVGGIEPNQVILMAERRSAAEVAAKAPMVAGLCSEHGFRYTPRPHLDLLGAVRES